MQQSPPPSASEFESFVERIPFSGCWIWMRSIQPTGYGDFRRQRKHYSAHRYSYELYNGPITNGLHVLHRCDVPCCCNPSHLFLGTNLDNIQDSSAKGRRNVRKERPTGLTYVRRNQNAYECRRKTSKEQREEIRKLKAGGVSNSALARMFEVSPTLIHRVLHGQH